MIDHEARAKEIVLLWRQSMLNKDENYVFHDTQRILSNINAGCSYLKTYDKKLIKDPSKDILLPCILVIDKTNCDSGGSWLQIEYLTISHGLLKHDIYKDPAAVHILGYINLSPVHKFHPTPVLNIFQSWIMWVPSPIHWMSITFSFVAFWKSQTSYPSRLQDHGFTWKLEYCRQLIPVVFHPYVPFIIGDTEGHNHLFGHYTSCGKGVLQLCRLCECPDELSGDSKARDHLKHRKRTPVVVNQMAWQTFGLHLLIISTISEKYFRQRSFSTIIVASLAPVPVAKFCTWCYLAGSSMQLNRSLSKPVLKPVTTWSVIIHCTMILTTVSLKGHNYCRCLLVILISLCTSCYQEFFSSPNHSKKGRLGNANHIQDWKLLVSSLLQWHAECLKKPFISRESACKSGKASSWLV